MEDLISVIVPVYNVEDYLRECLDSIIRQTYQKLEIILVDDGSTDHSGGICDEYAEIDKRIKVVHKINGGLSSARNTGIEISTGTYIGFVDSDDYIAPNMYASLYNAIVDAEVKIACCDYYLFKEGEHPQGNLQRKEAYERLDKLTSIKLLFDMNHYRFLSCNKLYSTELFKTIRFPENRFYEDILPIYNVFKQNDAVAYIKEQFYFYRFRSDSISKDRFSYKDYDLLDFITKVRDDALVEFPDAKDHVNVSYFFYSLSFINKAIVAKEKVVPEEKLIYKYIRHNLNSIIHFKSINLSRRIQIYLFFFSPSLYRGIYLYVINCTKKRGQSKTEQTLF